jgi:hypothetical protein
VDSPYDWEGVPQNEDEIEDFPGPGAVAGFLKTMIAYSRGQMLYRS